MAYDSSDAELAAVERWIDPATGKPNYSRFTEHNLEERTLAAVELYRDAHYPNIKNAAAALEVPYYRVYGRHKGRQPISHNGGQLAVLTPTEDQALLIWAHRQVMCGHHIQIRRHRLHVKRYSELLVAIRRSRSAGPAVT
ncbi:hypothetical protein E4U09_003974 [Claviceps aff. purpurea]|uniref:Uncharacterized protein n=1 Tax=Claviceps aff. purpurea TaxID=1967640 RepID=A0A9P7QGE5_9HYPO|nr:hypothetical protein E4U09_003974 [Claviceps aff. purpurea]